MAPKRSDYINREERERRVRAILAHREWTLYRWSQVMGVPHNRATRYLESNNPRLNVLIRMSKSLGCPITFLILRDYNNARGK